MVYRRTAKMEERKAARRSRFVDVATNLFAKHGYHNTTVPMIVAESGASTGSFYFYFRDKEDVFGAVLNRMNEKLSAELNDALETVSLPLDQMRTAVQSLFLYLANHRQEARILIIESSGLSTRLERIRREILASHTRSVEKALSKLPKSLRPRDPQVMARCWIGAVYEAGRYWLEQRPGKQRKAEKVAEEIACFCLRGIGTEP